MAQHIDRASVQILLDSYVQIVLETRGLEKKVVFFATSNVFLRVAHFM